MNAFPAEINLPERPVHRTLRENIHAGESWYHLSTHTANLATAPCTGLACLVARKSAQSFSSPIGATPQDGAVVHCLGSCFEAPAPRLKPGKPLRQSVARHSVVLRHLIAGGAHSLAQYRSMGGYKAMEWARSHSPQELIQHIEASELRGRGGAGFPTGRKWRMAQQQNNTTKHVIANADEGDPGAYIDRYLMEEDPHALLEGMMIAAHAIGATQGWIYLRCEYPDAFKRLKHAIDEARSEHLLGKVTNANPWGFDIHIAVGEGSYICGEESALIRSMEGFRPEAMARPPYAVESGLGGFPTLVNNVETLCSIPWIVEHGPSAYRAMGFSRSRGTKVLSLNSLFRNPGLYEVEFGISLEDIVHTLGGGLKPASNLKGLMVGGPLAGVLPPDLLSTRLGFEEMRAVGASVGHGGVIAFDQYLSARELLHHVASFSAFESCGKCTPCRVGCRKLADANAPAEYPESIRADRSDQDRWIRVLKDSSLCGLGTGLADFAASMWRHYREELEPCPRS